MVDTIEEDLELAELRDMGILSDTELEQAIEFYQRMRDKKQEN